MYRVQERVNNIDTATFRSATEDLYRKLCFQICYYANAEKALISRRILSQRRVRMLSTTSTS